MTQQQLYCWKVPLGGGVQAVALLRVPPPANCLPLKQPQEGRGPWRLSAGDCQREPSLLMSCAHITAALIQVSIVMSNLQNSHTTEGKDDPALTTAVTVGTVV